MSAAARNCPYLSAEPTWCLKNSSPSTKFPSSMSAASLTSSSSDRISVSSSIFDSVPANRTAKSSDFPYSVNSFPISLPSSVFTSECSAWISFPISARTGTEDASSFCSAISGDSSRIRPRGRFSLMEAKRSRMSEYASSFIDSTRVFQNESSVPRIPVDFSLSSPVTKPSVNVM